MNHSRAALRYAKATLDFAVEKKAAQAVAEDMHVISDAIAESAELRDMLGSPIIQGKVKQDALKTLFKGRHEITLGVIDLLVSNKRISLLSEVALRYIAAYETMKGNDVAYITTAVPLTPDMEKKALEQIAKITDKEVVLESKVDKDLIGGFILRVGDIQYDASIATKLETIQREFTKSI